ncbi:S1 family peptidase [Bdellovibrio bacteriovorus]|uniref:S1 family peptidase n=1 Tax=Bdellovibrio bacteriovorus TaxID=959 RepID=UPI003AA83D34
MKSSMFLFLFLVLCSCQDSGVTSTFAISSDSSIIGGENVEPQSEIAQSSVVLTTYFEKDGKVVYKSRCSGVLISLRSVLTAAHCFIPDNVEYASSRTYVTFLVNLENIKGSDSQWIQSWVANRQYIDGKKDPENDIAIALLKSDAPSPYKPAKIARADQVPKPGDFITSAGYGISSEVPRVESNRLKKVQLRVQGVYYAIVVVNESDQGSSCFGDSGGPSFIDSEDGLILYGINVSGRGVNGKHCNQSGSILLLSFHRSFIAPYL